MIDNPSIYRKSNYKEAPCPNCKLHIRGDTKQCEHCGHELTQHELESLAIYVKSQKVKGIKMVLVFFPVTFILIYILVSGTVT
jgi:RNA polymerase subunit RPABC4/transcription elongation factor Spt4